MREVDLIDTKRMIKVGLFQAYMISLFKKSVEYFPDLSSETHELRNIMTLQKYVKNVYYSHIKEIKNGNAPQPWENAENLIKGIDGEMEFFKENWFYKLDRRTQKIIEQHFNLLRKTLQRIKSYILLERKFVSSLKEYSEEEMFLHLFIHDTVFIGMCALLGYLISVNQAMNLSLTPLNDLSKKERFFFGYKVEELQEMISFIQNNGLKLDEELGYWAFFIPFGHEKRMYALIAPYYALQCYLIYLQNKRKHRKEWQRMGNYFQKAPIIAFYLIDAIYDSKVLDSFLNKNFEKAVEDLLVYGIDNLLEFLSPKKEGMIKELLQNMQKKKLEREKVIEIIKNSSINEKEIYAILNYLERIETYFYKRKRGLMSMCPMSLIEEYAKPNYELILPIVIEIKRIKGKQEPLYFV